MLFILLGQDLTACLAPCELNPPATPVIDEERPAPRGAKQALALCNTAGEVTTADLILHPW